MSRLVLSLEDELGFRLFNRSRSGVVPTRECESCRLVMRELARWAESRANWAGEVRGLETGRIRVGMSYPAYYPALGDARPAFRASTPVWR